jgi:class 3 adenylate cyclase/tetratricopeptide (TPR) repeat protein
VQEGTRTTRSIAFGAARTLTFLFADLRDWTRFVETRGDRAASELIAEYRRIVRGAIARTSGAEIKTEGDSFYVVFEAARQAVECGIAILQEADLRTRERPDVPIRVGVGIHAGEPVPHEGQYVGSAVNLAARLTAAAGAGELLVSDVVRGLLRTSGVFRMEPRDGLTLKGIDEPPRVFAVEWHPLADRPTTAVPTEVAVSAAPPPDRRVLCPVLVGRDEELARLESLLASVRSGRAATVLIGGDAGVGKSAFLRAFAERVRTGGSRYLVGECIEVEARRPFGPFVEVARALVAAEGDRLAERLPPELASLLSPWDTSVTVEELSETERYRIHAAILRLLDESGRHAPLVVALEDLHWGDEATLELFPYLARKLRETRVLLVATYRSDELHRRHPLRKVIADLERARAVERVDLRPLDEGQVGDVIRAALRLDRAPTEEFRALIHERCEGNPLFIEEVLRALVERGELAYRDGSWRRTKSVDELVIPDSIRDAVLERAAELDDEQRRILQHAAVIGQRFDLDLLQRVTKAEDTLLIAAMRAAIEAQMIDAERTAAGAERFAFRHALTREAVVSELLQRERQIMHRAVGEALETLPDATSRAEELAYHFDAGGEIERAIRYRSEAARAAMSVHGFARAAEHLERAIVLVRVEGPELADLHIRLAEAAYLMNDLARGERAASEARRIFGALDDVRAADALYRLGIITQMRGDFERARAQTREAIALLEPHGASSALALAYARLGRLDMVEGRPETAIEWSERAREMAERVGDRHALVYALTSIGSSRTQLGDAGGVAVMRESTRIAMEAGFVEQAMTGLNNLIFTLYRTGQYDEARGMLGEIQAYCAQVGRMSTPLLQWAVWYAIVDGDFDRAIALERESEQDSTFALQRRLYALMALIARDGPEKWIAEVDAVKRRLLTAGNLQSVRAASIAAAVRYIAGDLRGVIQDAEARELDVHETLPFPPVLHSAILAMLAARTLRDVEVLDRWIGWTIGLTSPFPNVKAAAALVAQALSAERGDDVEGAQRLIDEVPALVRDAPPSSTTAIAQLRIELLLRTADRATAQQELASVIALWRRAGAPWYLDRLSEWARERGLDPS